MHYGAFCTCHSNLGLGWFGSEWRSRSAGPSVTAAYLHFHDLLFTTLLSQVPHNVTAWLTQQWSWHTCVSIDISRGKVSSWELTHTACEEKCTCADDVDDMEQSSMFLENSTKKKKTHWGRAPGLSQQGVSLPMHWCRQKTHRPFEWLTWKRHLFSNVRFMPNETKKKKRVTSYSE